MSEAVVVHPPSPSDRPWVVGDIGGTNARFGWVDPALPDAPVQGLWTAAVLDHAGPAEALRAYLRQSSLPPPAAIGLAVATAIDGDEAVLTNSPWRFRGRDVGAAFDGVPVALLNDFEALALALPGLQPQQVRTSGAPPRADGVLAVVGPGTGLGVAAAVPTPAGWVALPGEGGHATLAPVDDFESRVLARVRARFEHVSAERLLSGIGLPVLHVAVAEVQGRAVDGDATARDIVDAAIAGGDPDARATLDHFCAMLGGFCGSVVLTVGARAGLYVGGGIVPRLGDAFFASRFRERFEAKGRFRGYLEAVPTAVVTDTLAALGGVVAALRRAAEP